MKYTLTENLDETLGTISNLHGFLHCFHDRGFKTKWTGYWSPSYKYLDYYAVKINGIWLNNDTLQATEYGEHLVFHHDLDTLKVTEKISCPDQLPGFKVVIDVENKTELPKAVRTVFETGVDIRDKSTDIGPKKYKIEETTANVKISQKDKKLKISSPQDFKFKKERRLKTHYPGEKQRCLIPGDFIFEREIESDSSHKIELNFTTSQEPPTKLDTHENTFTNNELGRTFDNSIDSLENLIYDTSGRGIIAGHPWFQSYWARDTFWSLLGLIDLGYFNLSEQILENFASKDLETRILLDKDSDEQPRADTEPLFIIACDKLRKHHRISQQLEKAMENTMEKLELEDNIVRHKPEATWMDTLERPQAVDIQSLWLEAAEIMNDSRKEELEDGLKEFYENEYMRDSIETGAPITINPSVPLMFGQLNQDRAEKYLEKINACFSSRFGARTRSMADPGYRSEGYHSGSVWGLTTTWASAANLRYGKNQQGLNFLEKMTQFLDRNQPGALPEVVNAETGELLGAPEQAWSAGMFVHVVDTYLLGISVEKDHVEINPVENISCERHGKRIGNEEIDMKIHNGEVEILNDTDLDIRH